MELNKENARHALDNLLTQERYMNQYAFDVIKAVLESLVTNLSTDVKAKKSKIRKEP